ncbi:3-hydroxyacyl-CoA dehydrogenase/enoyl-CoA hydratase family protein [Tengunoibacter tsumagoiensis]|uniref:3-hydroxyacyl-CoA dehydrogenase n=1 Tax=Tengunoibacter tsumagoiensis TaxID=2014871 RepID=A0A401ZWE9_9CHLR|nr:3-hydroxyacyl-CoA dehydrogenase/enoyl-CoA hydratase family protein [Tengunoibacter tsumagoiensis]GCE11203.1 3-hydroxyacyl-CoA dehydrogenase [Tengunoibacter tsumagoiensis]
MTYAIRKVGVVGAGVMGAAIAAHLANVGIPSLLVDIVPSGETTDRNRIARTGLEKTLKARPASFYSQRSAQLITIGNIEDDLDKLADVDWIIEAVVERLDIKHALYEKIESVLSPTTIISSNTSGLPAHQLTEGRSERFRNHFLITHFFNPVRYMRLLELVPTAQTDPELLHFMQQFGSEVLGKGVVICKDTPNFIANRLGVYGFMSTMHHALAEGYTVSEVDMILGPNMGRPKSAVFRTSDLSGLDTLQHVGDNLYQNAPDDEQRATFLMPEIVREIIKKGWLGEKSGQGFYKRIKGPTGESIILELNLQSLEYEPQPKHRFDSIGAARKQDSIEQRIVTLLNGNDRASQLARETTADALIYAAKRVPEIADDIVSIDNAMRWGFNFELGSFELWDILLTHPETLQKVLAGRELPPLVKEVQTQGQGTFYREIEGKKHYFDLSSKSYQPLSGMKQTISLTTVKKKATNVVRDNGSAALVDLGDGIGCLEFHTKMNSIDEGIIELLHYAVQEGSRQFRALVIGNEAPDYSAGANLLLVLMGARQGAWEMLNGAINGLQQAHQLLKYSPIPVVAAPAGRALGGGCELIMHCNHTRALAESYIGLVETGVGLVPAGGGCKELLLRQGASAEKAAKKGGPFTPARKAFEIIAVATVSSSAVEAQELRFLRKTDAITLNRDLLLYDAKDDALKLAEAREAGKWQPPQPELLLLPGSGARLVLEQQVEGMLLTGKVSEHDAVIGKHLAHVLTGGNCSPITPVSEQYVLDLEREAFLSLCGMEKTQQRIEALLNTGKPLRN